MSAIPPTAWRKSSYSGGSQPNCVEVGPGNQIVGIRDTKNREAGSLHVSAKTWTAFIGYIIAR